MTIHVLQRPFYIDADNIFGMITKTAHVAYFQSIENDLLESCGAQNADKKYY